MQVPMSESEECFPETRAPQRVILTPNSSRTSEITHNIQGEAYISDRLSILIVLLLPDSVVWWLEPTTAGELC